MNRLINVTTALGDRLRFSALSGREEISHLFDFSLTLKSEDDNLFLVAEKAKASGKKLPKLIIRCGTEDKLAIEPNRRFKKHLDDLGIENDYAEFPGIHSWEFWDTHIQYVLEQLDL